MKRYVNILYRLAWFLDRVPPEALGAMILVVLNPPSVLVALALWMLNAILGQVFVTVGLAILMVYVWSKLSPQQRHAVKTPLRWILPNKVAQHLGIMPGEDPSQDRVPKAWSNGRVEIELHDRSSNLEKCEKRYGTLIDSNDLGVVVDVTFFPWTSIKAITYQPHAYNVAKDKAIDKRTEEPTP